MATIKIHGKGLAEATIVINDEGKVSYECSWGMHCFWRDEIRWEEGMDDAIEYACKHVERHDQAILDMANRMNRLNP